MIQTIMLMGEEEMVLLEEHPLTLTTGLVDL
jgi:hypothetical protein